ncbi:adenosylcobinamide-phosphate synthase [Butyrivibrio proteoclasticus]|uniref:Cobalamin biosynthesis protein CobD n=1 Tax=Butyrivibrio proteoclasticus TaxID=43305 RepID=A0A1I5QDC2_9FIRM|nr:adenosylcobinamide-phosphate synthase CbiB [Butyrivibrio proteoclasticus]SFP44284.1 adenosylcobinamide-phosphate synthase [Butyrivibrio proteoclasticus]
MALFYRDFLVSFLIGIALDTCVGDPKWLYHPVQAIGALITFLERRLLKEEDSDRKKRVMGVILVIIVLVITGTVTGLIVFVAFRIDRVFGIVVMGVLSSFAIAGKSLRDAAMDVYRPLAALPKDIESARRALSMIVGRDTQSLDEAGILRATVETVSENTNDGVICPMFYLIIGGPVLAFIYKAVSTMDSMIGYKNDKYRYFGTAAARLDDILAFIPARISALYMIFSALILGYDPFGAFRIWRRDRYNHESPNSAQCESVCAGALGLRLAGPASYFGKIKDKPFIGDDIKMIDKEDILRSISLMQATESLLTLFCLFIYLGIR